MATLISEMPKTTQLTTAAASSPNVSTNGKHDEKRWVYLFSELDAAEAAVKPTSWDDMKALLGGKGANLAEMTRLGLPVPPGFTVTTEACNAFSSHDRNFPEGMWAQEVAAMKKLEEKTGKHFGDPVNPLFVSCRSGAKFSMPGMMDTVLNIGLNDETAKGMVSQTGDERFVYDSYRRLVQMFGAVVLHRRRFPTRPLSPTRTGDASRL